KYAIEILATANLFKKDHRIALDITSLDLPTGISGATDAEYVPYHICSSRTTVHRIFHDARRPSHLLLPVIPTVRYLICGTCRMNGSRPNDRNRAYQRMGVAAIVGTGLLFIWRSLADLPLGTIDNPGPAAIPLALAILLVVFALWSLKTGTASLFDSSDAADAAAAEPGALRHAILVLVAVTAAAVAINPLGYRLTMLALLLFFLGAVERKRIVTVLIVSFALSFGSYALFDHLLKVTLPTGPFRI